MIKEIFNNKKRGAETELGFGTKNYNTSVRFLNRDGSLNIRRKIKGRYAGFDVYHWLITMSWARFTLLVFGSYIFINTVFAGIYYLIGADKFGGLKMSSGMDDFLQLFFFSAQTLTTVGYGHIYPNHTMISSISAIESMFGLLGFALATGIMYGRFSRPKADIEYSDDAVIAPYQGITGFMFRLGNKGQYELIENECELSMTINNKETKKREFHNLDLERKHINYLAFSWTIVHPIDERSPLFGLTEQELIDGDAEFIVAMKSINDTYSQAVFSRISYKANEVVWNAKFAPIKQIPNKDGSISIDMRDIHLIERL
jgi:inward rectifier potassium channel